MPDVLADLVALCRSLGEPQNDLAILAEGNVSATTKEGVFLVKASGHSMRDIGPEGFVHVRSRPILEAFEKPDITDAEVRQVLSDSRLNPAVHGTPSVETFMHAYLLALPGVSVIGHTHPTPLVALLSLKNAERFATQRLFPDDVVCCGPASCFVPYVDPGLPLARAIRDAVVKFNDRHFELPKTIWLQNHGLIALGRSVKEVESATFMSAKSARMLLLALSTGEELRPLSPADIARIHTRPDEHYRQRLLWAATTA
jgi:rhamnose utilization protein RhaD (predicted bifunctional aldolase and dehydrogenase)